MSFITKVTNKSVPLVINNIVNVSTTKSSRKRPSIHDKAVVNYFCHDLDAVIFLQQRQWLTAAALLMPNVTISMNDKDFGLYDELYGAISIQLKPSQAADILSPSSLVYYRIFKSGNDNIRSLLHEYAFILTNETAKFSKSGCPQSKNCAHNLVHRITAGNLRYDLPTAGLVPYTPRFAFTFVREPILRFVSALNEVEYRGQVHTDRLSALPVHAPLGTLERLQEWMRVILLSAGSQSWLRLYGAIELGHIAPQIGTILFASALEEQEGHTFHLYHIERFQQEWQRLAKEANLSSLGDLVVKRKHWHKHKASSDPFNTSYVALSFLSLASFDADKRYGSHIAKHKTPFFHQHENERKGLKEEAQKTLLALCRLYLVDFMCARYELPWDCRQLHGEVHRAMKILKQNEECAYDKRLCY